MSARFAIYPVLLTFLAVCVFSFRSAAADADLAFANLRVCVEANLAQEKGQKSPSIDSLLKTCNAEYRAWRTEIPARVVDQADRHLRNDLVNLLRAP